MPENTAVDLSIVIPTYNESGNIRLLIDKLTSVLDGLNWEVIFVDDHSPDKTGDLVYEIAKTNPRVRLIYRIGRRGLSSACIEGMASTVAPYLGAMDADLQHDETRLPEMFACLQNDEADVVIGSRFYNRDEKVEGLSESREKMSHLGNRIANKLLGYELSDPLTGFFMLKADVFRHAHPKLTGEGFKILIDILSSAPKDVRVKEIYAEFRERHSGESKLSVGVIIDYGTLLLVKFSRGIIPNRFLSFLLVGASGALIHLAVLKVVLHVFAQSFYVGQFLASTFAMTWNYYLNNKTTYRDKANKGWLFVKGLIYFYLVCFVGLIANVILAGRLFEERLPWWVSGLCGTLIASIWNFGVSSILVWRKTQSK